MSLADVAKVLRWCRVTEAEARSRHRGHVRAAVDAPYYLGLALAVPHDVAWLHGAVSSTWTTLLGDAEPALRATGGWFLAGPRDDNAIAVVLLREILRDAP